ncbi:ADP-ribosyltransferase [Glycomyces rhizosphaerae]|uniref:ADP-ribosyltransferase n=1 Tax=Glycomyces rhizosphaerae TaxID=2054422 RepID=A0ABV7PW67_9ACTN
MGKKKSKGSKLLSGVLDDDKTLREGGGLSGKAKTRPDGGSSEFTDKDREAIAFYSGPGFRPLNKYLLDPDSVKNQRERDKFDAQAAKISNALDKLPPDPGTTYRGTKNKPFLDRYQPGDVVDEKAFISSSKDRAEAEKFASWDGALMEIKGKNGKSIEADTKFQGQDEVVFDRNSKFKVTGRDDSDDLKKIFLEEV